MFKRSSRIYTLIVGIVMQWSLAVLLVGCVHADSSDDLYVVQRDAKKLSVVAANRLVAEIADIGDMSHATVKFFNNKVWVISRDGVLSRLNPSTRQVEVSRKVGDSGIGFTFTQHYVVVANYEPKRVVFLDFDLNIKESIDTGSRNVGVKSWGERVAFALMDKDEVWVVDCSTGFAVVKKIVNAGEMPFDALIDGSSYVVGFFNDNKLGILDLADFQWHEQTLGAAGSEAVLKVPHFGTWGVTGQVAFVPGVKERKLNLLNLKTLKTLGAIQLPGLPVFAVVSPNKKLIAVNYSGDQENNVSIIDVDARKVLGTWPAGQRIMHLRFSKGGSELFLSSYFDNKLKTLRAEKSGEWTVISEVQVHSPSGIFYQ